MKRGHCLDAASRGLPSVREKYSFPLMTDKQAVMDALQRLPENASLEEIAEELNIMASVRRGRREIRLGQGKSHDETKRLFQSWAAAWNTK